MATQPAKGSMLTLAAFGFKVGVMRRISGKDVIRRIRAENPWWEKHEVSAEHQKWEPRGYFDLFFPLVKMTSPRRAVVLMGHELADIQLRRPNREAHYRGTVQSVSV